MRRVVLWLVLLPAFTLLVFGGLTLLSFLELRTKRAGKAGGPEEPQSTAIADRYREETRALAEMRRKAREDLTAERLLAALSPEKGEEIPSLPALTAWLRAIEEREADPGGAILLGLLGLWKTARDKEGPRRAAIEALLSQAILSARPEGLRGEELRADLLGIAQAGALRPTQAGAAALLLLGQIGRPSDVPRLEELRGKTREPQYRLEIEKAIEALTAAELSRAK